MLYAFDGEAERDQGTFQRNVSLSKLTSISIHKEFTVRCGERRAMKVKDENLPAALPTALPTHFAIQLFRFRQGYEIYLEESKAALF